MVVFLLFKLMTDVSKHVKTIWNHIFYISTSLPIIHLLFFLINPIITTIDVMHLQSDICFVFEVLLTIMSMLL